MKLEQMITLGRGLLAAVEVIEKGISAARDAIASGKAKLKDTLADLEEMRETLVDDRGDADSSLEKKFKDR